jgi:hypothetical protein
MESETDDDEWSLGSTDGGVKSRKDSVDKKILSMLEHLGTENCIEIPFGEKNRMTVKKDSESDRYREWNRAWNDTIDDLAIRDRSLVQLVTLSAREPDHVQGGCRWHKQILEYLVIEKWIRTLCDESLARSRLLCAEILAQSPSASIVTQQSNLQSYLQRLEAHDSVVSRITTNVRNTFKNEKIFTHTIKGKNQKMPHLKEFFDTPTPATYHALVLHLAGICKARHEELATMYQDLGCEATMTSETTATSRKRRHRSDAEVSAIKKKHMNKCRGPPRGASGATLTFECCLPTSIHPRILQLDHCLPISVFKNDSNDILFPMDPTCHIFKTKYVDPVLIKHKDDADLLNMFVQNNTLPDRMIHEINMRFRRDFDTDAS